MLEHAFTAGKSSHGFYPLSDRREIYLKLVNLCNPHTSSLMRKKSVIR